MTTWGFIGSGHIGSTVARLAVAAGDEVLMSNSRGPDTLADLVADLGPQARAVSAEEAARTGDVVVVTIPFNAVARTPVAELAGKVVIDTTNYYPARDGLVTGLEDGSTTSSELVQEALHGAHVVKAFNNIQWEHLGALARPAGDPERTTLAVAGDDPAAKTLVRALLDRIGYDSLDLGPLAAGRSVQPGTPAYGTVYAADPDDWGQGPTPVSTERLRAAVAAFDA